PLAVVGSTWLMYWQGFNFSIAVGVGFIALAGLAVEIGVIMLVYLKQSVAKLGDSSSDEDLKDAVISGAGLRVRPIMMTTATVILGLLPILLGSGTGSEIMSRIAAPMVGGMISTLVLTLLVLPATYYLWQRRLRSK
ncbi:MAG: efflux RND transporter permease subunit, partial [Pseudohongiellaceae bacterium]